MKKDKTEHSLSKRIFNEAFLVAPLIMETGPDSQELYPCAVAESGAVIRIKAFDGMYVGQRLTVYWEGLTSDGIKTSVTQVGRYLDVILPKRVVLESVRPNSAVRCDIYYEASLQDGTVEYSSVAQVFVRDRLVSNAPVTVPDASGGEFDPQQVPEPGLKIEFPRRPQALDARWSSYARNGSLLATVRFAVHPHEDFVHMWRLMLKQTEPGGDVWINYYAANDEGPLVESLYAVLRVTG